MVRAAFYMFLAFTASDLVSRKPGETLKQMASRIIPAKSELAHVPVQGAFGPGPGNVVVLSRPADDVNTNYSGLVLAPTEKAGDYRVIRLPALTEIPGRFEIDIKAVFFENVDSDPDAELLVLCDYHRNGSQDDDTSAVHIYKWQQDHFIRLEGLEGKLVGLPTAAAVRARLKQVRTTRDNKK
jgi:hypothetical protein